MYVVTGVDRSGHRFRMKYDNKIQAMGINLWRGSVWLENEYGQRKLLKRVYN